MSYTTIARQFTKQEAEAEAIRRWYLLPPHQRQTCEDAEAYGQRIEADFDFYCVTSRARLIGAWLIRELFRARAAEANDELIAFTDAVADDRADRAA
ncbi:MAG TPA: hypothetical protein VHZ56_05140 [Devosia sp.]|nr:hypothetical protein [Devosia sp.]